MNTSFNQDPLTNVDSSTETVQRLQQQIQLLERCLEVRDARNRQLMAAIPQIAWIAQADGSIIEFNDRWSEYSGLSVAESLYWGFLNAVHPDERDRVVHTWHKSAKNGAYQLECRLLGKNGIYKSFKAQATAIVNNQGAVEEWIGTYTEIENASGDIEGKVAVVSDITAKKQLETEWDALRSISRRFFTLSLDMLGIAGLNGYFIELNPAFEKTLGYTTAELLSEPFINFVHPEDRAATLAEVEKLGTGTPTLYFENRYRCKNGEYKWLAWTSVPIIEENSIYAIARDITPTKQMEETLHRREQEYKALLEAIPDVIARCDREMRYVYVNPEVERTTGVPAPEFVGKKFAEMGAPPELCQLWEETLTKVFASGREQDIEFETYNLEGLRKFQSRVVPEFNKEGTVQYGLVVSRDLTELKQAEAEIRTLNSQLEQRVIERTAQLEAANQEKDQLLVREQAARAQAEAMEQRFRELVNGLVDAIVWECDAVTVQFSFISQSAERILGYPTQRWLTESGFWGSLIHPDDCEWVVSFCREETSHGRDHEFEYRCIAADGRIVWLRDRAYVVRDESGKIKKLRGLMIDITERKQAEEEREQALIALQKSEAKFRRVAESNMIGIVFWNMGGNFTDANDAFLEMLGYTREDLKAGLLHWPTMTPPEYQHQDEAALAALKRYGVCNPWEKDYIRKDGRRVSVLLGAALLEGSQYDGVAFVLELTERKRVEEALKESEERFRTMADTAPVLIWVSGVDGLCNWFNKPWLDFTGRSMKQEIGQGWTQSVHPADLSRCLETYLCAFNAREKFRMEYRLKRADGQYRWLLNNGVPRFLPSGEFAGYIGGCIDITDRIDAEEALRVRADELAEMATILAQTNRVLEKRNQELDQFAYVASHDLKAPLRAIANLAHWIEEDIEGQLNEETQQHLNLLRGRVHRMEGLINALLQYSRAGRIKTEPQRVNVQELLEEVIDCLAPPPGFNIEIESDMPVLFAERLPLQQVFSNLIANAIKHHHRLDGNVKISVRDRAEVYEFAVSDDGPGIAPQYHDKIFIIFQTLQPRDKVENTGVGLSLVKRILDSQGGSIKVKSAEGEGATFYFTLPKNF